FPVLDNARYRHVSGVAKHQAVAEILPGFFEISVSSMTVASVSVPWGGGGYFRLLPYPIFRAGARKILRSGRPYVFYIHPWEIDPDQPRPGGLPRLYSFRHYVGLERCEERFRSLLADFRWTTMADLLEQSGCVAQSPAAGV